MIMKRRNFFKRLWLILGAVATGATIVKSTPLSEDNHPNFSAYMPFKGEYMASLSEEILKGTKWTLTKHSS